MRMIAVINHKKGGRGRRKEGRGRGNKSNRHISLMEH